MAAAAGLPQCEGMQPIFNPALFCLPRRKPSRHSSDANFLRLGHAMRHPAILCPLAWVIEPVGN